MDNAKYFLDSKTIKGILIAILPTIILVLRAFGFDLGEKEAMKVIECHN